MRTKVIIVALFALAALGGQGAALAHNPGAFPRSTPHPAAALDRGICIDYVDWAKSFASGRAGHVRVPLSELTHCPGGVHAD